MGSLIDTNLLSEYKRPTPNAGALAWLRAAAFHSVYVSVVTLCEIRTGIDRMSPGRRRDELEAWLTDELPLQMGENVLPVTAAIADRCGAIRAQAFGAGRPMPIFDALLAATADVAGLSLVTRDVKDFEVWGGAIVNPWTP